jgi:protease-4
VISGKGESRILVIPVEGLITASPAGGSFGRSSPSSLAYVTGQLDAARKDKRIKAVVLKIDSPGGVVSACDAIYEELIRYKKERKIPIVAQQMTVAASGGYYLSMVADRVLAQPTTVTGSIGVIMMKVNAQGLFSKIGVADDTVKSGASKDMMSVFKEMAPPERAIIQGILDAMHKKFISVVTDSRKDVLDPATSFDGRVFIGADALARRLIDGIGYLPDAIEEAKKLAGLTEATVIRLVPNKNGVYNAYSAESLAQTPGAVLRIDPEILSSLFPTGAGPQFLYLWGW